jgi:hypothetical protein
VIGGGWIVNSIGENHNDEKSFAPFAEIVKTAKCENALDPRRFGEDLRLRSGKSGAEAHALQTFRADSKRFQNSRQRLECVRFSAAPLPFRVVPA